jgi:hypothetical protein
VRTFGTILAFACVVACLAAADVFRPRTRVWVKPGIPVHDWHSQTSSVKVEARSTQGMLLQRIALPGTKPNAAEPPRLRYFQLDRASLTVDHCTISRVALQMEEDGLWKLTLRAEQNYPEGKPLAKVVPGVKKQREEVFTDHIKRNQFYVRLRALAANPLPTKLVEAAPGAPVLFQLSPPPFWVERGEPYHHEVYGNWEWVRRYFNAIDRVEVEFFYR